MDNGLSPRDVQVLQLLARGWSAKMIAEKLDITKSAITNQLHFLYRRMGVPNNIAAVVEGIRRGIVKIGE